jgi:hypothetical protein
MTLVDLNIKMWAAYGPDGNAELPEKTNPRYCEFWGKIQCLAYLHSRQDSIALVYGISMP